MQIRAIRQELNILLAEHGKQMLPDPYAPEAVSPPSTSPAPLSITEEKIDTASPVFGAWYRNSYASDTNPHRDGRYVRTITRKGRLNPGVYYELTDGHGAFWESPKPALVAVQTIPSAEQSRDEAVEWIGVLRDELVMAGFPGGDRTVALETIRSMIQRLKSVERERDFLKANVSRIQYRGPDRWAIWPHRHSPPGTDVHYYDSLDALLASEATRNGT
jgi:hypothetical protein